MTCASARGITGKQGIEVRFEPGEERRIADQAVLDHLGEPGTQFARRQGAEGVRVDHHGVGLVEGADKVLAARDD